MTTPSDSISTILETLKNSLGDASTFRTWVGASGSDAQEQARKRVYKQALPPPESGPTHTLIELQTYRPFVIISFFRFAREQVATSSNFEWENNGELLLHFEQDVPPEIADNHAEIGVQFMNNLGGILDDLCDLAGQGGYLAFTEIDMYEPWYRTHPDEAATEGDAVAAKVMIRGIK